MAELSMPSLKFEITADGSAAIEELDKVEEAINGVKPTQEWNDVFKPVGDSARKAGEEADKLSKKGEDAGKKIGDGVKKASLSLKDVGEKMSSRRHAQIFDLTVTVGL